MVFKTRRMNDMEMNRLFEVLLEGLEQNAGLEVKRKIVNNILRVHKYKLLERFLSDEEGLSEEIQLNCLPIFLDGQTKYFQFLKSTENQNTVKSIFEIIPKYCPNVETVDLSWMSIKPNNIENFKLFLKRTKHLKSLRVQCWGWDYTGIHCGINQLLLEEDLSILDNDVQSGLLKIDYINGIELSASECAELLDTLPNLKSLGMGQRICPVIYHFIEDDDLMKKLNNLTEFFTRGTTLDYFRSMIKLCPKATMICLRNPGDHVIKNLSKFPLLKRITLILENEDRSQELIQLLKAVGNHITYLEILTVFNVTSLLDSKIIHNLCPKLAKLIINHKTIILN